MSKERYAGFLLAVFILLGFQSCKTDIEIIAPKKDVTVIYGLLEANKSRHYIRINKAFVGEEAASKLAAKPGINEYTDKELNAYVQEEDQSGEVVKTWPLQSIYTTSKVEGTFYNDSNKVYYFDAQLNTDKVYRIICEVDVEGQDLKTVEAETEIVGRQSSTGEIEELILVRPNLTSSSQGDRAEVDFVGSAGYLNAYEVVWLQAPGGSAYTSYYRFYYTEVDKETGERRRDSLQFPIGSKRIDNTEGQGEVRFEINPEEFFIRIDRNLEDIDTAEVDFYRYASDTLHFFLEVADKTLATYIEVNKPVTEVVQEQPEYTNVVNGIGIFASRIVSSTRRPDRPFEGGRILRSRTLEELLYSNNVNLEETYSTINKGFRVESSRCNDVTKTCR